MSYILVISETLTSDHKLWYDDGSLSTMRVSKYPVKIYCSLVLTCIYMGNLFKVFYWNLKNCYKNSKYDIITRIENFGILKITIGIVWYLRYYDIEQHWLQVFDKCGYVMIWLQVYTFKFFQNITHNDEFTLWD